MDEFAAMVTAVRDTKAIIGDVHYGPTDGEKNNLKFRRSLFAVKDIKAGEVITAECVRSIRPSTGIKPKYFGCIIGKTAKIDIQRGTSLCMEMFK